MVDETNQMEMEVFVLEHSRVLVPRGFTTHG